MKVHPAFRKRSSAAARFGTSNDGTTRSCVGGGSRNRNSRNAPLTTSIQSVVRSTTNPPQTCPYNSAAMSGSATWSASSLLARNSGAVRAVAGCVSGRSDIGGERERCEYYGRLSQKAKEKQ